MNDSIHHKQLRQKLVNILHQKGINNINVLEAINKVPRHLFINSVLTTQDAYEDCPQHIGQNQTISQPYTVAFQTALLDPKPDEKVLEVGTGSGYQAAILYELGMNVYTIERQKKLYSSVRSRLIKLGYAQINVFYGDGINGLKEHAPYDKILVTAGATEIPKNLIDQLKINGVLVIPVGNEIQKMLRVVKRSSLNIEVEEFDHFQFVPLLAGLVD